MTNINIKKIIAVFFCMLLVGCTPVADIQESSQPSLETPSSIDVSNGAEDPESVSTPELSKSAQIAEIMEEVYAVADDGTFYVAVVDCYSDTHLTEVTLRFGRLDKTPLSEEWEPVGEMTRPDMETLEDGPVYMINSTVENSWYEEGEYFIQYRIYTDPVHYRIAFHYFSVDRTPAELDLDFFPESVQRKVAGEQYFDDGMILDWALVAERSGVLVFYLPEAYAASYRTDDNGEVVDRHIDTAYPVQVSVLDADGGVICEKEGTTLPSKNDQRESGYLKLAFHFFFDEDDPLPLDEAASIVLNGNEIPLSEYSE